MATNPYIDSATIAALIASGASDPDTSVGPTPPGSAVPGNIWWDTSTTPYARRSFISGAWQDTGARFDPTTGQLSPVQAGVGLNISGPTVNLDIEALPVAP